MTKKYISTNIYNQIVELNNNKEFKDVISKYTKHLILTFFYFDECNYTYGILDKLKKIRNDNINNNVIFLKINLNNNDELISEHDLTSCPIIHLYKKNELIKTILCTYDDMNSIINEEILKNIL